MNFAEYKMLKEHVSRGDEPNIQDDLQKMQSNVLGNDNELHY